MLGFSPVLCREICTRAGVDPDLPAKSMTHEQSHSLTATLNEMIGLWKQNHYTPCVAVDANSGKPADFHAISLTHLTHLQHFDSISDALNFYYQSREKKEQIKNRSIHLIRLVKQNIERCEKKF
ncbi:MAG: hypothetical protein GXY12_00585 [Clostridiaceae bacterium]|nr:hypothetical protein [Clostridiaceae bacterium]